MCNQIVHTIQEWFYWKTQIVEHEIRTTKKDDLTFIFLDSGMLLCTSSNALQNLVVREFSENVDFAK